MANDILALYGLTVIITVRVILSYVVKSKKIYIEAILFLVLILLFTLPVASTNSIILLIVMLIGIVFIRALLIKGIRDSSSGELVSTVLILIFVFFIFSDKRIITGFNSITRETIGYLIQGNERFLRNGDKILQNVLIYWTGGLLAMFEANYIVVYVLKKMKLGPSTPQKQYQLFSDRDLGRGRMIGYLERLIIFAFVLNGNIGSIGFVLTAKALARFRELDNREFAEYVLIGTLLSVLAAASVGAIFSGMLL